MPLLASYLMGRPQAVRSRLPVGWTYVKLTPSGKGEPGARGAIVGGWEVLMKT